MNFRSFFATLAFAACLSGGVASAATFVVDSTVDGIDAMPGDGICATADGACTLRAAVMEANENAGPDVIDLATNINDPLSPITLTIGGVDETFESTPGGAAECVVVISPDASQGDLDITEDVSIQGAGPGRTVIRWDAQSIADPDIGDRIFHVQAPAGVTVNLVSIADLMVTAGSVGVPNDLDPDNPYNCSEITGTEGSRQVWQFRRFGGGIAVGAGAAVVLFQEQAHGSGGGGGSHRPPDTGPGGGEGEDTGGITAVAFERIAVIGNWSGSDAGGLIAAAEMSIEASVFSSNLSAANGGALYLDSPTTIAETLIGASVSDVPYTSGAVSAALLGPNTAENGGGIFATGSHTSSIESSAINGNQATGGGAIAGRSLVTLNVANSTISGNSATDVGGGITTNGQVNLRNVTLVGNSSASDAEGGGAGLNSFGNGSYRFLNTILSNNTVGAEGATREATCGCTGGESVCPPGRMVSEGFNLSDEAVDTCSLSETINDQIDVDPLLEPLANYGGLTETHGLPSTAAGDAATSPAIDTADTSRCPNNDQRGSLRPDDGDLDGSYACDVGAFELFIARTDLHINNVTAPNQVDKGEVFDVIVEVHNDDTGNSALGVTLDSELDSAAGLSIVDAVPSTGTCNPASGTAVSCDLGDLAIGATATVTLSVSSSAQGSYTLTSTVSTTDPVVDTVTGNNTVSSAIAVLGYSDIQLTGGAGAAAVDQGDDITFDYVVTNLGEDDATNTRFGLTLPAGAAFVSAVSNATEPCVEAAGDVVCPIGDLAVSEAVAIQVVVATQQAGSLVFPAAAVADQNDPSLANNEVASEVAVIPHADLGVTLTSNLSSVRVTRSFSITIRTLNNGPQDATNVVTTVTLPSSVTLVSTTGCTISGSSLACATPGLASGATATHTVSLTAGTQGQATINATVAADEDDPVASNDSASVTVAIRKKSSGGGCAYNPGGAFDPTLPGLLLASLAMLLLRRRVTR